MSNNLVLLIARVLLSVIFILAGLQKLGGIDGTTGYIASKGLPMAGFLAWGAAIFEVVAGVAILVGFQTRFAAYLLSFFCIVAGLIFHFDPANQIEMIMFMKNMAIAGGFLALASIGPGSFSFDGRGGA